MKRTTKIILFTICLLALASALTLAACQPKGEVTVTLDWGLQNVADVTFRTAAGEGFLSELSAQAKPLTLLELDGFYLDGEKITYLTTAPDHDFTVKAQWLAPYSVEYYLEQADGSYQKDNSRTLQLKGTLGSVVTAEETEILGFACNKSASGSVPSATLAESGTVLKLYYDIASVTVAFDKGNAVNATGSMAPHSGLYNDSYTLPQCGYASAATFVGYNTSADGTGTGYKPGDSVTLTEDLTLYAVWQATVTQTTWLESDDTVGSYTSREDTFTATVGTQASARNPDASKYTLVVDSADSKNSGTVGEDGLTLNAYFDLRVFTVTYADDGATQQVRWGGVFTVRTPENTDPDSAVISYCSSSTGNGRDYPFAAEIVIKSDLTLYPVIIDVYTDDADSGDIVKVRRNMTGKGAATLVRDGKEYEGYISVTETLDGSTVEFEIDLNDGNTVFGKLYNDEKGRNLFLYRSEEAGTYMYIDPLYYDAEYKEFGYPNPNVMLVLDGYGAAVLAMPESNTERVKNYFCTYEPTAEGDYYLTGVFPGTGEKIEMYFSLAPQSFDIGEGIFLDGYFMQYGWEGDYAFYYYYNLAVDDTYLMLLDGYGHGELYEVAYDPDTDEASPTLLTKGMYFYADYFGTEPEMIFWPETGDSFYFILQKIPEKPGVGVFSTRHNEQGDYTPTDDGNPATLSLDGYNGAYYSADGSTENERTGFYTIKATETEGVFTIILTFTDDNSVLAFEVNLPLHTFKVFDDGFVVTDGVLTEYLGNSTVLDIPEGVTEIAANVFANMGITSLSLPSTLTKIGDRAFEDSSVSGGSALRTVYFKSATPPELGEDVFRWIKGSFKIYVPEGAEETYREAFATPTASQPQGYGLFVTSLAEQANKPLYEVVNGVLVSYNNKDINPQNVAIVLPEGVTEIADGVFAGLYYIVSADLTGVKVIGENAFRGCANLASVTFDKALQSVGAYAFYECALTELSFGSVDSISELAFARNFALVSVTFDGAVGTIEQRALYECGRETNADETEVTPLEMDVTFHGSAVPTLNGLVFDGVLQLRTFVDSFEIGVSFVETVGSGWGRYATSLRVKATSTEMWYSKSNAAAVLELGDRIMFNETYFGLYKREGETIKVSWFEYDMYSTGTTILDNVLTIDGNYLRGMSFADLGDSDTYVLVKSGTTITYKGDGRLQETLEITFGSESGKYCGNDVQMDYSNYRTHFIYDGYTYNVTLTNNETFSYTRTKIVVELTYTAEDGSTITIYEGDIIQANGCLKNVNGIAGPDGNGLSTTTRGWYLTSLGNGAYMFRVMWLNDTYVVTVRTSGSTFTYSWELAASLITYRASNGDIAVVTKAKDGTVKSIHILFKTSNGTEEVIAAFTKTAADTYTVTVNSTVTETAEDGTVVTRPSEFNGTYTLVLNEGDLTFTLTQA